MLVGDCVIKWINKKIAEFGAASSVTPASMHSCWNRKLSDLFVFFLYGILPLWKLRNLIRLGDASEVNRILLQLTPLFSATNKWKYMQLSIQVVYSTHFFPEGVRKLLDDRFLSYTGEPNKKMAPDQLVEFLSSPASLKCCTHEAPKPIFINTDTKKKINRQNKGAMRYYKESSLKLYSSSLNTTDHVGGQEAVRNDFGI